MQMSVLLISDGIQIKKKMNKLIVGIKDFEF